MAYTPGTITRVKGQVKGHRASHYPSSALLIEADDIQTAEGAATDTPQDDGYHADETFVDEWTGTDGLVGYIHIMEWKITPMATSSSRSVDRP